MFEYQNKNINWQQLRRHHSVLSRKTVIYAYDMIISKGCWGKYVKDIKISIPLQ